MPQKSSWIARMPLKKGKSKKAISDNFSELYGANKKRPAGKKRPKKQIIAIVISQSKKPSPKKKKK